MNYWGRCIRAKAQPVHHILIIDDSEFDRRMIRLALENTASELKFTELNDGSNVLEQMAKISPSITFLDIRMPGKSGFDILSEIKSDHLLNKHTVVLVSGSDAECDRSKASDLGAAGYFKKPHTKKEYRNIDLNVEKRFLRKAA